MNVFVTGSTGMIGRRLVPLLEAAGHQVIRLVRGDVTSDKERYWDTGGRRLTLSILDGCEALVHLAGENIAGLRWTEHKKDEIYDSRISSTAVLAEAITRMETPPKCFIVASATGYYGNRADTVLTESSPPGFGFLSEVCQDWEHAADPARALTRVVHVRTGIVLGRDGGALKSMLMPFKLGLGGALGGGAQYWSWISGNDIARLYKFCIENESIVGPVNGVSPDPVTNREFTQTLAKKLNRPAALPVPAFVAKLALGEMADELLLASTRVIPKVAQDHGFTFEQPTLGEAL
ncbi:TIGR01777 family oxidoreductase [Planctomicrobium piriforme]|uniref:TIGR01777 family protein n=1 Tax=Planctomicrobium piriforme TaxID=1576369 RepID=A0A1I3BJV9_9PLAN|nr:TIGR01777 family oxidoreductase [Planctomicrobium piriforme]SFH62614.1 hypothetical protein SAMN05421753_101497 [Planctomicrobium piriforme]